MAPGCGTGELWPLQTHDYCLRQDIRVMLGLYNLVLMEKTVETTIIRLYRVYIRVILGFYYIGIAENKMETTIGFRV